MTTDRPGFSESTDVLPYGLQWEGGFSYTRGRGPGASTIGLPGSLLRMGISRRVELRAGGAGFVRSGNASGFSDHEFTAKVALLPEAGLRPALSVIGGLSTPVGARAVSSSGYDPGFKLAWSKGVPAGLRLSGTLNYASVTSEGGRCSQRAVGLAAGRSLAAGFSGYAEIYGVKAGSAATGWAAEGGVTRALGPNAQFDIEFGRAVARSELRWFFGFGLVVRHPTRLLAHR